MPPIEIDGARSPSPVRPAEVRATQRTAAPAVEQAPAAKAGQAGTKVETVGAQAAAPRAEVDRVAEIRKAVESGNYPLIPKRVADAMIAAGLFLRKVS